MADKVIYAMYDDDDTLLNGAKHLVKEGVKVSDVYSPFPLHGIDPVIGVEPTRLGIAAFMYGLTGTMLAIIGIRYMFIIEIKSSENAHIADKKLTDLIKSTGFIEIEEKKF